MHSSQTLAARNNAEWCGSMCRSHGLRTLLDQDAWTSAVRTPPLYPDAVTLRADAEAASVLARIDASPGCSVKDSFSSLDLAPHGFTVLFDAQWIVWTVDGAADAVPRDRTWRVVADADELAAWAGAWRSGDDDPEDLFRPPLLTDRAVRIVARWEDDQVVAGAVLNHGPTGTVGISNVFYRSGDTETWPGLSAVTRQLFPAATALVGYESGADLDGALRHGFHAAGPLRVWRRGGAA